MRLKTSGWFFLLLILQITAIYGYNYFSPLRKSETFIIVQPGDTIQLKYYPVIEGSVNIFLNETSLQDSLDYIVDYQSGTIKFTQAYGQIKIEYADFPESLKSKFLNFKKFELTSSDSIPHVSYPVKESYKPLELVVKGNKTISISVTDGEDYTLDQSLFLRINGKMSDNVNIQAQVSDSESPITPEGDSREISNLDQIFIRIYGKKYELGFGDLEHHFQNTEYLAFTPYFEGVKVRWGDKDRITGGVALSRSQNAVIEFSGIDGNQGPYWLSNSYGGDALIIAGSETVYLNGYELQRGDDYTIDYAEGSLTFNQNNFISSSDNIYVKYQYSDEIYRQQVYLQDSQWNITDNLKIGSAIYYRSDDRDNPLTVEFNESDLDSLHQAGDGEVYGNGIYPQDTGFGEYILNPDGYFEYVGLDSTGTYNLSFHYDTEGDYLVSDSGYYYYVGSGNGNYSPGVKLQAPEAQGNYTVWSRWNIGDMELKAETLLSTDDRNTLSDIDDEDNLGWAGNAALSYKRKSGFIKPQMMLKWKGNTADIFSFVPLSSAAYLYETEALPDTLDKQEISIHSGVDIGGIFMPGIELRKITAGDDYTQRYLAASGDLKQYWLLPEAKYRYLTWENALPDRNDDFYSHSLKLAYNINRFKPGYEMKREEKEIIGIKYSKATDLGYLEYKTTYGSSRIYWEQVITDSTETNQKKISRTTGLKSKYRTPGQQIEFSLAHRNVKDSSSVSYDMAELSYNGSLGKMVKLGAKYRLRNLDFYPKVRELVYIGFEEGNYNEDGEEDENGDYDWQIVSIDYDNPSKSIEITSSGLINIKPADPLADFWQKMRLELEAAINEQSTTDNIKELYLLQGSELRQEDTTIYGTQVLKGRWWYDLIKNKLSLRLMKSAENRLDNRYQDAEKVDIGNDEAYLRWRYSRKISWEFYLEHRKETDTRYESKLENYDLACETRFSPTTKFNYSIRAEYGWEDGSDTSDEITYNLIKWELLQSVNWYPKRTSRLFARIKYRYNDRNGEDYDSWLEEKRAGNVFIWSLSYDYKLNSYVKFSLEYKGDKYPDDETSHEFKMQASAEF